MTYQSTDYGSLAVCRPVQPATRCALSSALPGAPQAGSQLSMHLPVAILSASQFHRWFLTGLKRDPILFQAVVCAPTYPLPRKNQRHLVLGRNPAIAAARFLAVAEKPPNDCSPAAIWLVVLLF